MLVPRRALVCVCVLGAVEAGFFDFLSSTESTTVQIEAIEETTLLTNIDEQETTEADTWQAETIEVQRTSTESSSPSGRRTTAPGATSGQFTTELQIFSATQASPGRSFVQEIFPPYRPDTRSYPQDYNDAFGYSHTTTSPPENIYSEPPDSVRDKALVVDCRDSSVIEKQFLRRSVRYSAVTLVRCRPPADGSYAALLLEQKVYIGDTLSLLELRPDAVLTAAALAGLGALRRLTLSAAQRRPLLPRAGGPGTLVPAPGALAGLPGLRALRLDCVRPDRVPHQLTELSIRNTGLQALWDETVNITVLSIQETSLPWIPAWGNNLKKLTLVTEAFTLPQWPRQLARLVVEAAEAEYLSARSFRHARALRRLELRALWGGALPGQLLASQAELDTFLAEDNHFETLPPDLFAYSSQMEIIYLRKNKLLYLPKELFSGLSQLRELWLDSNELSELQVVPAVRPLRALQLLSVSGNPLGDLCPDDVWRLPDVTSLSVLRAARTLATRVCSQWLRGRRARALRVDLSDNLLTQLPCGVVDQRRGAGLLGPRLRLTGNPIRRVACSRADFERAASNQLTPRAMKTMVTLNSTLECSCNMHWAGRLLRERNATGRISPEPALERPCESLYCS